MNVSLLPHIQKYVEDQLEAGRYETADQLVNAALAHLQAEEEQLSSDESDELRAEVAAGIAEADRGEVEPWDVEAVRAEVERRYAEEQGKKAD